MQDFLNFLIARAAERSTWLGLTGLVTALGISLNPEQVEAIIGVGLALGGTVAVFTRDA